uniref:RWD domain-containing protein n=1 Tax=Tetraselmis chuii TaxID=63592 RepID=A0A7S1X2K1_9CHLO|mmetsp:Transcript_25648/g.45668  ORF Transcript_25648/g.45668 Transcript_25648/m.45668 type:complete len:184 (+) Transcript_25648:331-882(+)
MVVGDAVEEGNAERQLTEVEALSAIFPDAVVPVTRHAETAVHDGCNAAEPSLLEVRVIIAPDPFDDAPVELIFLLPTGYPSDSPPVLTGVACSEFSRAESGKLQTALDRFLAQAYRDSPSGAGQECLYDAVLVAQDCVTSMRSSGLDEIGSAWVETDDANEVENTSGRKEAHCCLLRIDRSHE